MLRHGFFGILALSALLGSPAAMAQEDRGRALELIEPYTAENFGFGDDGEDCPVEVIDLKTLSESGGAMDRFSHALYSYRAEQPKELHGCGISFNCYALIQTNRASGEASVAWANCALSR